MSHAECTAPPRLLVAWARHGDEVRQAQRLRFEVFARELGAQLTTTVPGHDVDRYDDLCDHLLVRDQASGAVVGTYRALTPAQARRAGPTYTENEFDLAPLAPLRSRMLELGRSCVHADHRHGAVLLALWGALAQFMALQELDLMIGCASMALHRAQLPQSDPGPAGVWNRLRHTRMVPASLRIAPITPLPMPPEGELASLDAEPPPLVRAYLRLGARVLGPPAWDPNFRTADLPLLLRVSDLPRRYRRGVPDA